MSHATATATAVSRWCAVVATMLLLRLLRLLRLLLLLCCMDGLNGCPRPVWLLLLVDLVER